MTPDGTRQPGQLHRRSRIPSPAGSALWAPGWPNARECLALSRPRDLESAVEILLHSNQNRTLESRNRFRKYLLEDGNETLAATYFGGIGQEQAEPFAMLHRL